VRGHELVDRVQLAGVAGDLVEPSTVDIAGRGRVGAQAREPSA